MNPPTGARRKNRRPGFLVLALALAVGASPAVAQATAKDVPPMLDRAREYVALGDNYRAIDLLLEAVKLNPAYAPAYALLARCNYELGEYERAVFYIKEAGRFGPRDPALVNLDAYCLISLGKVDDAKKLFEETLKRLPNDRDARFGMTLIDLRAGRSASARITLASSLRAYPDDARALVSMALIAKAGGKTKESAAFLKEALRWAGDDPDVCYAAALASAEAGNTIEAARLLIAAITARPSHSAARGLLASLYYDRGAYDEALAILDTALAYDQKDYQAWFLIGLVETAASRYQDAERTFSTLVQMRPDDEIARIALENLVMDTKPLEDPSRASYAAWRWARAAEFERRLMFDKALSEYRRGLAIDPYANVGRRKYAALLRLSKLPSTYLEELHFLRDIGKSDLDLDDALEIYESLLEGSVARDWKVDPALTSARPYTIAVYSAGPGGTPWHAASDLVTSRFIRDLFSSSPQIQAGRNISRVATFTDAFRPARESGADYFLLVGTRESERDIQISAELRVARTGALALRVDTVRSGNDRLHAACAQVVAQVEAVLPLQGRLLERRANTGLMNIGRSVGIKSGDVFLLLKNGSVALKSDTAGLTWKDADIVARFTVTRLDDELSEGTFEKSGFFDSINPRDILVREPPKDTATLPGTTVSGAAFSWPALFEEMRRLY